MWIRPFVRPHDRAVTRDSRPRLRVRLGRALPLVHPGMAPTRWRLRASRGRHSAPSRSRGRRLLRRRRRRRWDAGGRRRNGRAAGRRRREQAHGVDVAVRIGGHANPEVNVRAVQLGRAARADRADVVQLGHGRALDDADRPQMRERDGVAVRGLDRDRLAVRGHGPGEAHRAGRRRDHGLARRAGAQVDAAVLVRGVRVRLVVDERLQDRPLHGPAPGIRSRRPRQVDEEKNC